MTAANPTEGTDMHLPYATAASRETLSWNISSHAAGPHCLIVDPTGGGKTSVICTLLTEAARRGIPFVGVDPKTIELDSLETEPNCVTIIGDALRAAGFIQALHREMPARVAAVRSTPPSMAAASRSATTVGPLSCRCEPLIRPPQNLLADDLVLAGTPEFPRMPPEATDLSSTNTTTEREHP